LVEDIELIGVYTRKAIQVSAGQSQDAMLLWAQGHSFPAPAGKADFK